MGYFRNHSMIFEGQIIYHSMGELDESALVKAHVKAKQLFGSQVSNILGPFTNGSHSFFIAPDGSKEGWNTSDDGNKNRDRLIEWLECQKGCVEWAEVQFGDDCGESKVIRHSGAQKDK